MLHIFMETSHILSDIVVTVCSCTLLIEKKIMFSSQFMK